MAELTRVHDDSPAHSFLQMLVLLHPVGKHWSTHPDLPRQDGALLLILLTLGGVYLLVRLQFLLILLFLSVLVACGIAGPVRRLERRGVGRAPAILIVYTLIGAVVAGIGWYALPRLVGQAGQAGQASVSLREVAQEDMILGKPGDVLREIMEGYFRQVGFTPRVACEVDEPAAVEDYVAAGLGVAFIPGMAKPLPNHDMTSWVRITEPICQLTMGIAWNEIRYLSQAAHAFRRQVMEYYATDGQAMPIVIPA